MTEAQSAIETRATATGTPPVDHVTFSILSSALVSLVDEMIAALQQSCMSFVIFSGDVTGGLLNARGELVAQGTRDVAVHVGALQPSTQAVIEDFGPAGFEEGLARTLDAFARLPLKPEVADQAMGRIVQDLATRLRIEAWHKANPDALARPVEGPVLVCGLPRTGTTATVGMLALDPRFRFPRMWEMADPVPPRLRHSEPRAPFAAPGRRRSDTRTRPSDPRSAATRCRELLDRLRTTTNGGDSQAA